MPGSPSARSLHDVRSPISLATPSITVVATPERLEQHLDAVAAIVERVAVKSLSFARDLDVLSSVREAILRDVRG